MSTDRSAPERGPTPEQLAAFADGELKDPVRAEVEAWLADHPEAAAEVAAQRDLLRMWREAAPPEPSVAAWSAVADRIAAGTLAPRPTPRRTARPVLFAAVLAAAAAVLGPVAVRSLRPVKPLPVNPAIFPAPVGDPEEQEPFAVMAPDRVRIISMDGDDTCFDVGGLTLPALVVGELPVPDDELRTTTYARTSMVGGDGPVVIDERVPLIVDPVVLNDAWWDR